MSEQNKELPTAYDTKEYMTARNNPPTTKKDMYDSYRRMVEQVKALVKRRLWGQKG